MFRSSRARWVLALLSTVLALAGAELLLGGPLRPELLDDRDEAWQERTQALHAALYQADSELGYVPRPGASVVMDYGVAAFNSQGLREHRKVARTPPEGSRRVAMLGDSLVWGELLAREHTLPAVLDARLGSRAEVLNFGVSGYDTVQEARWYTRQVRPFEPDVVVLVFCLNDLLTMSGPLQLYASPPRKRAYELERAWVEAQAPVRNESISRLWLEERRGEGSQLLAAAHHVQRWHQLFTLPGGYTDELLLSFSDPARVRRMEEALTQLGKDLDADGVRGLVVISPALYWWHRYQWWGPHEEVRQAAEGAGLEVLDPMRQWVGEDPEELRFSGDNLHYTAAGMERLADAVQPALEGLLDEVDATPAP